MFLDPYGAQVEWATIEAVADTRSIDLWILFPLSAVNRMLKRSGEIPEDWRRCLNRLFGTENWYDEFYTRRSERNLFGETEEVEKASFEVIGKYFNQRLSGVFPGVSAKPRVLTNSTNSPLFLLCFAVGNPSASAKGLALKIANEVLRSV